MFVFAEAVAAHRALAGFACDVIFGDDIPGTGVDAIFTTDASLLVDDHRSFFILCDCFNGADGGAGRKVTMHAAVAGPEGGESFEHRRLHGDPVGARQFVERRAWVIVPILAGLHTVTAADAFRRIE